MRGPTEDASVATSLFHGPSDDKAAAAILPAGSGRGQEPGHPPLRLCPVLGATGRGGPPRGSAREGLGRPPLIWMVCSLGAHKAQQALRARGTGLGSSRLDIPTGTAARTASEPEPGGLESGPAEAGEVCDMAMCSPASGSQELEQASLPRAIGPQSVMTPQEKIQRNTVFSSRLLP